MYRFAWAFAVMTVLFAAAPAEAVVCASSIANCPGAVCTQLGATQMAADKSSIVACVLKTGNTSSSATDCVNGGGCEWKSMAGGGTVSPTGTLCGTGTIAKSTAGGTCHYYIKTNIPCKGQTMLSLISPHLISEGGVMIPAAYNYTGPVCPSGYHPDSTAKCPPCSTGDFALLSVTPPCDYHCVSD